ncbi:28S ribosomal protein S29, mitochondrial [Schistocerca nitens]|uniref:28S ribosomal protein S29, mitochondrial n=1 Tax=Schistocerca nitens TaxID=7011 RepID=UPI0021174622|nr:28S ribosomal protein S29, mitochondrial [Schistocerca nitens]
MKMVLRTLVCDTMRNAIRSPSSRFMSAASAEPVPHINKNESTQTFRTTENDPVHHTISQEAKYYTISPEVQKQLFTFGGLPTIFKKQVKTFAETCVMVRRPALEVFEYLRSADYSKPAIRYVLFGRAGSGKTLTLAHVLHYGLSSEWLLFHAPKVRNWLNMPKEVANSQTKEGCVDLPIDAAEWLAHFKMQNSTLLNRLDLRVSRDLTWSKRESTSKDAPLMELIELGINRVKYACDIVSVIAEEIKLHSTAGRCKTLVVIDGFNAFFYPTTRVFSETKKAVPPSNITLTEALLNITKFDWCNGAIVLTVDKLLAYGERRQSDLPVNLLGKEGFEHLDPFVPIHVPEYSDKEIHSCLDYYADRRWIQNERGLSEDGRKELIFISAYNPRRLMLECASL